MTHNHNEKTEGYYSTKRINKAVLTATEDEIRQYNKSVKHT